jgi:hypothetical protein
MPPVTAADGGLAARKSVTTEPVIAEAAGWWVRAHCSSLPRTL